MHVHAKSHLLEGLGVNPGASGSWVCSIWCIFQLVCWLLELAPGGRRRPTGHRSDVVGKARTTAEVPSMIEEPGEDPQRSPRHRFPPVPQCLSAAGRNGTSPLRAPGQFTPSDKGISNIASKLITAEMRNIYQPSILPSFGMMAI